MVRLSVDLIARGTSGYTKKKRDEDVEHYLRRLTHLYLEDKCIDDVGEDLALCKNLSVLYLYDNKVERIPDLSQNEHLTHLYLQNNQLTVMTNLNQLRCLTKLYLGNNSINVVEGLDRLENLEELHLEHQSLPPGEKLLFDPRSLFAISHTLRVLNVSGNNLDSISEFAIISDLHQFMAAENKLTDMKEVADLLSRWRQLTRLDLYDNPFCLKAKYRDRVIVMSNSLSILDGKEISDTARQFLQNWKASKDAQKKKKSEGMMNGSGDHAPHYDDGTAPEIKNHMQKISSYVMPGLPRRQFEEVLAKSSAVTTSGNPMPYSAPPTKSYSNQSFVTSPTRLSRHSFLYTAWKDSVGQLQRRLVKEHLAPTPASTSRNTGKTRSHAVQRTTSTIQF